MVRLKYLDCLDRNCSATMKQSVINEGSYDRVGWRSIYNHQTPCTFLNDWTNVECGGIVSPCLTLIVWGQFGLLIGISAFIYRPKIQGEIRARGTSTGLSTKTSLLRHYVQTWVSKEIYIFPAIASASLFCCWKFRIALKKIKIHHPEKSGRFC